MELPPKCKREYVLIETVIFRWYEENKEKSKTTSPHRVTTVKF